jgi:hypothetical protein
MRVLPSVDVERVPAGQAFLKDLAVAPTITHEKLDELPGAERPRNCGATNSQSATTNGRPAHSSE